MKTTTHTIIGKSIENSVAIWHLTSGPKPAPRSLTGQKVFALSAVVSPKDGSPSRKDVVLLSASEVDKLSGDRAAWTYADLYA